MIVLESLYTFSARFFWYMTSIIVSELSFNEFFGLEIKVGFRAYLVCAEATFVRSQCAQKLLLRMLGMRTSYFCAVLVCAKVYWESVMVAALYSECAHQQLLHHLSMRKSCCFAY